jgi:hypothetical protein
MLVAVGYGYKTWLDSARARALVVKGEGVQP